MIGFFSDAAVPDGRARATVIPRQVLPRLRTDRPELVTPDELPDRDNLALEYTVNGGQVQKRRTSQLTVPVAELVARLSAICPLLPSDFHLGRHPCRRRYCPHPTAGTAKSRNKTGRSLILDIWSNRCSKAGTSNKESATWQRIWS